jgi:adenylate cyclase
MSKRRKFTWSGLSAELQRRRVFPTVAAYAVASWLVLQVGEVTFEPLRLPAATMVILIALIAAGFPVVALLAWHFDVSLSGIRRDTRPFPAPALRGTGASIAVLPFVDMSPEGDQGYFCEGIAEEILNALTRIDDLRVAARSSSFRFRESGLDVHDVGRALEVDAVLEGSVRKSANRLRITAQLVDVEGGYDLWSRSFDNELEDVFEIQDVIASSIADALLETMTPGQQKSIRTTSSADIDAYDYYLRGRHFFRRFRKTAIQHARSMFRHAIDIDPRFALAWAGYADCNSLLAMYADPNPDHALKAKEASERALDIDPNLAEAHASRGLACLVSRDFSTAEKEFRKALAINPRLYEAYYYFGRTRFHQGDIDAAAELFAKAADADPTDYQSRCLRAQILRGTGRLDEARAQAREAVDIVEKNLEWNPDDARSFHLGAGSLIILGEVDRARRWLRRALELDPDDPILLYNVACNFATLGDLDESLNYLERAARHGTVSADWMRNDEDLAALRGNPRYRALLRQAEARESSSADSTYRGP